MEYMFGNDHNSEVIFFWRKGEWLKHYDIDIYPL